MKSSPIDSARLPGFALLLAGAVLCLVPACSRSAKTASLPALSDPAAGLTLTLPETAAAFTRSTAATDRYVSRIPYGERQTLVYLHVYSTPALVTNAPPAIFADITERILRDELGAFLTLETSATNLPNQTPALLLCGRARDPDKLIGFAFQCNKTHLIFIGLSGPEIDFANVGGFFETTVANLHVADVNQNTFADATQYQQVLGGAPPSAQSLDFIRNIFAARNANPVNYTTAIGLAYILARDLQAADPSSPLLPEAFALLDNMSSIRLADFLKARIDYEVAIGQGKAEEAFAQARFLSDLTYPFDSEGRTLAKQRLRKAAQMQ